jgi:hypothetical protein
MTGGRRFTLSSPDWGQDHLSLDAIVAYVDDELAAGAHDRAEAHLACCAECRAEVVAQIQARSVLRAAGAPNLPSSLLRSLRSIPVEAELPPPPPGLGITADGQFVLLRDVPRAADHTGPDGSRAVPPTQPGARSTRFSRRARIGAVSGLAFGALAAGALAVPGPAAPDAPGVLGGDAVLNVPAQARLSGAPDVPAVSPAVAGGLRSGPAVANPAVANPAVATSTVSGDPASADPAGRATDAATSAVLPTDDPAAVDGRLRAELDKRPVAFFSTP